MSAPVTFTVFRDLDCAVLNRFDDVAWTKFCEYIAQPQTYATKASCPLFSFSEFGDKRSDKNSLKHSANVLRSWGAEGDYDGEQVALEEAARRLGEARLRCVIYTSPSHTTAKPRWRVFAPFSEAALPEKRREYVGRLNRALGGILSRESFSLSQGFYVGQVAGALYEHRSLEGRDVDCAYDLDPLYPEHRAESGNGADRDPTTDAELRHAFSAGAGRYQAMLKLSSRWAQRGTPYDDIVANLRALFAANPAVSPKNADGVDLRTYIQALAASAVRKARDWREAQRDPEEPAPPSVVPPINWRSLKGVAAPARMWWIQEWLSPDATLCSGVGGIGKTILWQTLATTLAAGREFLAPVTAPLRVLMWACEDDQKELHRRQERICRHFGLSFDELDRLAIVPRRGLDNTLLALEYGKPVFTAQFWLLAQQVNDLRADIFICDNVAQTYGGNENDRHQVTVFVNGLSGMVQDRDFAAVCLGHVARSPGSEFSGSSAWENACRMRWYMGPTLPDQKAADDDPTDPDLVYVAKRKANYTERDYRRLRFRGGLFVLDTPVPGSAGAGSLGAQETVIRALRQLAALNRTCSVSPGPSYFPKLAQQYGLLDGVSKADFVKAMRQLEVDGKIGTRQVGQYPNRVAKMGLVVLGDP